MRHATLVLTCLPWVLLLLCYSHTAVSTSAWRMAALAAVEKETARAKGEIETGLADLDICKSKIANTEELTKQLVQIHEAIIKRAKKVEEPVMQRMDGLWDVSVDELRRYVKEGNKEALAGVSREYLRDLRYGNDWTLMHVAVSMNSSVDILRTMEHLKDTPDRFGCTPMCLALELRSPTLQHLIELGANPFIPTKDGRPPSASTYLAAYVTSLFTESVTPQAELPDLTSALSLYWAPFLTTPDPVDLSLFHPPDYPLPATPRQVMKTLLAWRPRGESTEAALQRITKWLATL
eukprot:TRINITY_DN8459_c0_g1_i1.p1 TRINITY_DN8459_c0_g1~~TRINITY_DN8459_c0_g1_i1.p1  ORF type:complete len:293 (+),score=42.85 TRINITY_DN8459_c0_g1_i1:632-1510(+)